MMPGMPVNPKMKNFNQQRYFNQPSTNGNALPNGGSFAGQQLQAVINQLSYYFSVENLVKDIYLRKQMNSEGYLPISVVANFYRVQTLSGGNYDLVVEAFGQLEKVEVIGDKVRMKEGYQQWIFPENERDENGKDEEVSDSVVEQNVDAVVKGVEKLEV